MSETITRAELERVAAIYRSARERGERPSLTVMTTLGLNRSATSRRLVKVRALGLLEPARPGRTTPRNAKAEAIAQELGVTYEALVGAVLKHANGDFRVASI
jgi:hypothetical protein